MIWTEALINMFNLNFWKPKPKIVQSELNDTEIKVLSRYLINQQTVINSLTEQNMKLTAEVQVLRDVVDELSNININSNIVNKTLKLKDVKRRTSPFRN